jgi:hypothetical protein
MESALSLTKKGAQNQDSVCMPSLTWSQGVQNRNQRHGSQEAECHECRTHPTPSGGNQGFLALAHSAQSPVEILPAIWWSVLRRSVGAQSGRP